MSAVSLIAFWMRICIAVFACRSASLDGIAGSLTISNGRVTGVPPAVRRTVNLPGAAIGPVRCGPWIPQCTIGRVVRPLNRGSSQMCGLSGGVVRRATCCDGS